MNRVLIDTSIWIEYFSAKPRISFELLEKLAILIRDDQVVSLEPVRAEIFSGSIRENKKSELKLLFDSLTRIDLNWSERSTWDELIHLADIAKKNKLTVPGVVDRMILLSAQKSKSQICTLDKAIQKLATYLGIEVLI